MEKISIGIITYNEELNIERCLKSCQLVTSNIIIIDSFSTDSTLEICKKYNCEILKNKFNDYSDQRNFLLSKISSEWVLIIDADEEITENLASEINNLIKKNSKNFNGYKIRRQTIFNGEKLRFIFQPDKVIRLFIKTDNIYYKGIVHEELIINGNIGELENILNHYNYTNIKHWLRKMDEYSFLCAKKKNQSTNLLFIMISSFYAFFKFYIIKLGFLDGLNGLLFSVGHCLYIILKGYYRRQIYNKDD